MDNKKLLQVGLVPLLLAGCGGQLNLESNQEELTSENGMASNGMASNGMASNGMASNGMASNGMASNGMASNGMASNGMASNGMASNGLSAAGFGANTNFASWLTSSNYSPMLVKYTAKCALRATDTPLTYTVSTNVKFCNGTGGTWNSSNLSCTYTWYGEDGLAPQWAGGSIATDTAAQEWISACLLAHVNSYGIPVEVSLRAVGSPNPALGDANNNVSAAEASAYPKLEAAFWGNIFLPTPSMQTCWAPSFSSFTTDIDNVGRGVGRGYGPASSVFVGSDCRYRCAVANGSLGQGSLFTNCQGASGVLNAHVVTVYDHAREPVYHASHANLDSFDHLYTTTYSDGNRVGYNVGSTPIFFTWNQNSTGRQILNNCRDDFFGVHKLVVGGTSLDSAYGATGNCPKNSVGTQLVLEKTLGYVLPPNVIAYGPAANNTYVLATGAITPDPDMVLVFAFTNNSTGETAYSPGQSYTSGGQKYYSACPASGFTATPFAFVFAAGAQDPRTASYLQMSTFPTTAQPLSTLPTTSQPQPLNNNAN